MNWSEKIQKWKSPLIYSSVLLNVFLVGFLAARVLTPNPPQVPNAPEPVQIELRTLPEGLSREAREEIESEMRAHREKIGEAYEQLKLVQEEINTIVTQEHINPTELERAFQKMRRLERQIRDPMQRAFISFVRKADRESRRALAREHRQEMRQRVHQRMREPNKVDGSRWSFQTEDGHIQFEMDGIKRAEMLEGLRRVKELEVVRPLTPHREFVDLADIVGLEELKDLDNIEIVITREKNDDGEEAIRFVVIDKDTESVVLEKEKSPNSEQ